MAKHLTPMQDRFCTEYLVDLNATAAAQRAGYSPKNPSDCNTKGPELLKLPTVAAKIQELMDKRADRTAITADYVLGTIKDTIERCRQAVPVLERNSDGEMIETGEYKFEHNGVLKGCELLGKHLKLFTDRVEHTGSVTLEAIVADTGKDE
jgi:phage terminase small subunit